MADEQLFYVRDRQLGFPVFDVDNDMYENMDAFTKFMPREYAGLVKYMAEGNRTRLASKAPMGRAIPNTTSVRVGPRGGQGNDPLARRATIRIDGLSGAL